MTYFKDLTDYTYCRHALSDARNVGWLESGKPFHTGTPDAAFLAKLWEFCKVSVAQSRGWHECSFCKSEDAIIFAERNGEHLRLGTAEIRVFSADERTTYAAPTLIYHYVEVHQYEPPIEFKRAVLESYSPNDRRYFEALAKCGLEWEWTSKTPLLLRRPE